MGYSIQVITWHRFSRLTLQGYEKHIMTPLFFEKILLLSRGGEWREKLVTNYRVTLLLKIHEFHLQNYQLLILIGNPL